jgi:hypothetical protein
MTAVSSHAALWPMGHGSLYGTFIVPDLTTLDGFNSNTWVYTLILGAGMTPPGMGRPRSIQFWDSTRVRGGPARASLPARAAATASSRQARGSV